MDALKEFLEIDEYGLHNMRDHPWHAVQFMAGLWAAKLYQPYIRKKMKESMENMVKDPTYAFMDRKQKGPDTTLMTL